MVIVGLMNMRVDFEDASFSMSSVIFPRTIFLMVVFHVSLEGACSRSSIMLGRL